MPEVIQSPRPPEPGAEKTNPDLHAALQRHDWKLTVRSIIIAGSALIGGIVSVLVFVDNRVAAQTDAGVKVHEQRIVTLEQNAKDDREKQAHDMRRINKKVDRLEDKLDLLLDKANVPQSKRPTKDDEP